MFPIYHSDFFLKLKMLEKTCYVLSREKYHMWSKDQFNKSIFITQFCNMLNIELQTDNHRDVIYDQVLIFIIVMEIIWNILNNALLADYFYIICIASSISHITGELRHMYIYCTVYIVSIRITSVETVLLENHLNLGLFPWCFKKTTVVIVTGWNFRVKPVSQL